MSSGATLILALLPSEGLLDEWADQLESLAREFDIKRKVDLENVAGAVRRVRKCTEERKLTVIDEPWLRQLHATLNSLKHCCERFNPIGPDYFKGRNWSRLVEPPDLASVVDSFEEKGRIDGVPPGPVPRKGSS